MPLLPLPPAEALAGAVEAGGTEEGVREAEEVTEDEDGEGEAAAEVAVGEGKSSLSKSRIVTF